MPEAVYGPGKTPEQCARIVGELLAHGTGPVLLTRADDDQLQGGRRRARRRSDQGRNVLYREPAPHRAGRVLVVTAGTGRRPGRRRVRADAASPTASRPTASTTSASPACTGCSPTSTASPRPTPSSCWRAWRARSRRVVGGLTAAPVVAVPTSVGYGASLEGVTALLAMHASCASGVTVVGIDNGFGAACAIARMIR